MNASDQITTANAGRVPLDLVTGFLGSGKTTLINAVLRDPAFAGTLVIVNEFGEVGLDHLLVSSADDQVVLLDSGCLCCASSGSLRDTLIDVFARRSGGSVPAFDRIIVETSGLANPAPLVASLLGDSALAPRCSLAQVLTLVDAGNGLQTLDRYDEACRQVAFADRLLISKPDTATNESLAQLRERLTAMNNHALPGQWQRNDPPAPHFTALPQGLRSGASTPVSAWMRGPLRPQYAPDDGITSTERQADHHGEAFRQITTHVIAVPDTLDWPTYADWTHQLTARLGKRLLRCKGLLRIGDNPSQADTPWIVQGVQGYFAPPERLTEWPTASSRQTFLVCIGESLQRAELDAILECSPIF
ncbi:CobW family GTP-binding protein [Ottowia thiooxydans]|uniref:CobW family GTP-binding protein n=1 Tax=Ottowia thiooxydans TaxID=219182 RepID=UPI0004134F34|nr:GTP-binding protein [Ottowia thiooxydans]